MAVIFATEADALRQELDAFYTAIGRGEDPRLAIVRLRMAFHRAETIATAFPEGWIDPDRNQRWGYARLVSVMKVSQHELSKCGDERKGQGSLTNTAARGREGKEGAQYGQKKALITIANRGKER
jgi:hypothetical protein